jgi:uncharacterized iron-regulated membrane protein
MTASRRTFWRRLNYELHLWLGLGTAALVLVVCLTGIVLNHKREFGIMNEPDRSAKADLATALPLNRLVEIAVHELNHPEFQDETSINRMDFRPRQGYIKVRFRDQKNTEVILDVFKGTVLTIAARHDVFMEQIHSGEIFGPDWVILSDIAAAALIVLTFSGIYIWLYPRLNRSTRRKRRVRLTSNTWKSEDFEANSLTGAK